MRIQIRQCHCTKYYTKPLDHVKVNVKFDYTKDYRDRLKKAQRVNWGASLLPY